MRPIMFILLLALFGGLLPARSADDTPKETKKRQTNFIATALDRFGAEYPKTVKIGALEGPEELSSFKVTRLKVGTAEELKKLESTIDVYARKQSKDEFVAVAQILGTLAFSSKTLSAVTLKTQKNNEATVGATIKYQAVWDRKKKVDPVAAKKPSESIEQMVIGYYHIWAERDGKVTTDQNLEFYIVKASEEVALVER